MSQSVHPAGQPAWELGPGLRAGVFPYETIGGRIGFLCERGLLKVLGERAFKGVSIVERVMAEHGLNSEDEFLKRYEASRNGVQELWNQTPRSTPQAAEGFYGEHDADLWRQAYRSRFIASYKAKLLLQARIVARLARGERAARILDYGCGAGVLANRLLQSGYRNLHLADVPSPTLEFCRRTFAEQIAGYHEVGATRPFAREFAGTFAVIASLDCMEHTVDPMRIARELVQLLAPGGGLVISYPLETDFSFSHTREAAAARPEVMAMLAAELETILPERVYKKRP